MSNRIRLLHITRTLEIGGMEQVVATLCRTVNPERYDSGVLCLRGEGTLAGELRAQGFPVWSIDSDPARPDYSAWLKVARLLRHLRPDVVHSHNTTALLFGAFGAKLAGVPRVIHTDHSRGDPEQIHVRMFECGMSRWVDRIVAVSDATAHDVGKILHVPRSKITTVPNGIEGEPFRHLHDRLGKRRALGLPAEAPLIGLAARLVEQKGLSYLLDASHRLTGSYPNLHVVIVGEGNQESRLIAHAARLGLAETVHFLGLRRDVPELLQVLDVYVLPSLWEGLPMGLLEAMAARRPIVATDVGGVGTAIEHGVSGLLVQPKNVGMLADAIDKLLADQGLAQSLGECAGRVFEERFSAASMARLYEALYVGDGSEDRCSPPG